MDDDRLWFDRPALSEAEIARLIVARNVARRSCSDSPAGFTEPRAARADGWPGSYHPIEHARRLDRILRDMGLS